MKLQFGGWDDNNGFVGKKKITWGIKLAGGFEHTKG